MALSDFRGRQMKTSSHHCHEKECLEYIDRETSRYWCTQHEIERRKRISAQLENLVANFPELHDMPGNKDET